MSYCRIGDDSDIYLIYSVMGHYECCYHNGKFFSCDHPTEMIEHLNHLVLFEGAIVPERALTRLKKDVEEWDNE